MKRRFLKFNYQFQFADAKTADYEILLDPDSLSMINETDDQTLPEWTRLPHKQCKDCPLNANVWSHCPIAVNIMELVETFKTVFSYHDCMVTCVTAERTYLKKTSVMEGLSAIFGMIMATSDCPIMEFLKPMARFHLPFATIEETTVRTVSMYLMAHYLERRDALGMTFDLTTLENHYARVQRVNEGLLGRINSIGSEDADKNAIITLHSLSQFLSMEIDYSLGGLERIFINRYAG